MDKMMGREGELVLVNGQHQPTVPAAPGAMQRWRIINGCASRVLSIRLDGHELVQVAFDGTFLPAPATRERVVLAPGNRVDVIVAPSTTGRYALSAEAFDRGAMMGGMGGGMGGRTGGGTAAGGPVTLATLVTAGTPTTTSPLPTALPAEAVPTGPTTRTRQIDFQMGMGMGMGGGGMAVTIDGRTFDGTRDDQTVTMGAIEEWTITNPGPLAYPFHLHAWPFTVLATSDATPSTRVPQDVVLIPARGWVRLRIPFTTYSGRSVYHCHILDHEDAGMMATVNVRG